MEKHTINFIITLVAATIAGLAFGLVFTPTVGVVAFVFMFAAVLHVIFQIKTDKEKKIRQSADGGSE